MTEPEGHRLSSGFRRIVTIEVRSKGGPRPSKLVVDQDRSGGRFEAPANTVVEFKGVRFTDVYAKRNGAWQMVTWQSTRLPA